MSDEVIVFLTKPFQDIVNGETLESLKSDFKKYKSGQSLPDTIGRDERYDHIDNPQSVIDGEVSHIHIAKFSIYEEQYKRTSEKHLVYCPAAMTDDCYLFIDLLNPKAHKLAKNPQLMRVYGEIAEKFRNKR